MILRSWASITKYINADITIYVWGQTGLGTHVVKYFTRYSENMIAICVEYVHITIAMLLWQEEIV